MPHELDEVRRWLVKAGHDWSIVRRVLQSGGPELDLALFHCQQAVEKMLKAYLVYRRVPFEKIHDLGRLLDYCADIDPPFDELRDSVEPLTIFAVAYRYPGPADPNLTELRAAEQRVLIASSFILERLPKELRDAIGADAGHANS